MQNYKTTEGEKEVQSLAQSSLKLKSEFLCFIFALEKKFGAITVQTLLNTTILNRFNKSCLKKIESAEAEHAGELSNNDIKLAFEETFKLISLFSLLQ